MEVKGYKVFDSEWQCREKQYTCPGKFEEDVKPMVCGQGMHFCKKAADCFNYYKFDPNNKVAEVIAYGEVAEDGDKCCTDKLEIVREIPWAELLEIVNTGKGCTGLSNSGNWNSGNWNSGNSNSGDWNSGDWNATDYSNGCFNTAETKIYLFNKPSDWTYRDWQNSGARYILSNMPFDCIEWIGSDDMTDKEKIAHPEHKTTGGFLREVKSDNRQEWWNKLSDDDKSSVKSIPNFNAKIFKEITGISVEEDKP